MLALISRTRKQYGLMLSLAAMVAVFAGCGGGGDAKQPVAEGGSGTSTQASTGSRGSAGKAEASERPNVGGVPLDVYFDNPLEVASDNRQVGAPPVAVAMVENPGTGETPGGTPIGTEPATTPGVKPDPSATAGGDVNWSALISKDELEGEVQSIRNDLNSRLTNFGAYKRSTPEIPVFSTTLAFLADVARRHEGDIAWKAKAHFIRALAVAMSDVASSSTAGVKNSYDQVNEAFLKICEILNNNDPAELPETEVEADFGDFADMGNLMQRLKRGESWLQNNAGSEDNFKEKADLARREVSVFAVISESFVTEGYGYNEYEDFRGWAYGMRDFATTMHKAVDAKNFTEFDTLRSKISQTCTQCHGVYRSG